MADRARGSIRRGTARAPAGRSAMSSRRRPQSESDSEDGRFYAEALGGVSNRPSSRGDSARDALDSEKEDRRLAGEWREGNLREVLFLRRENELLRREAAIEAEMRRRTKELESSLEARVAEAVAAALKPGSTRATGDEESAGSSTEVPPRSQASSAMEIESASRGSESDGSNAGAKARHKRGRLDPARARGVISVFDPDGKGQGESTDNIIEWIAPVEQLARAHDWDEEDRILQIHLHMRGEARRWFNAQLAALDRRGSEQRSWAQWKEALKEAFPRIYGYREMLDAISRRVKRPEESYNDYYRAIQRLCQRFGAQGTNAVSILIGGLPRHERTSAEVVECRTPIELYNRLLCKLDARQETRRQGGDEERQPAARSAEAARVAPRRGVEGRSLPSGSHQMVRRERSLARGTDDPRCFNCHERGHLGKECPKKQSESRCRYSREEGHFVKDCPRKAPGARGGESRERMDECYDARTS